MERQIERVLILADEPILKRPFPVELVKAGTAAGLQNRQAAVHARCARYLERYSRDYALTHASATGSLTHGATACVPNAVRPADAKRLGDSPLRATCSRATTSSRAGGVIAYSGRTQPTGSMLSLGFNWAQLDRRLPRSLAVPDDRQQHAA